MKTNLPELLGMQQSDFMFLCNEIFTNDRYMPYRKTLVDMLHPIMLQMQLSTTVNTNFPEISYTSQTTGEALGSDQDDIHQFYASNVSIYGSATGTHNDRFELKLYPSQQHPTIRHLVITGTNVTCVEVG